MQQTSTAGNQSVKPIFGEVHPRVLHEFADVAVDVRPISLLRHNSSDVAQSVVKEWISNEIVNVATVWYTCNYSSSVNAPKSHIYTV